MQEHDSVTQHFKIAESYSQSHLGSASSKLLVRAQQDIGLERDSKLRLEKPPPRIVIAVPPAPPEAEIVQKAIHQNSESGT